MPTHHNEPLLERYQREHREYEGMKMSKAERLIEGWCASITQEQHEIAGANLATELRRLSAINAELIVALKPLSAYPLEEFAMQEKDASRPLFGANEWQLLVGHVKAARAAIAKAQGEQP